MKRDRRLSVVRALMAEFAGLTGLSPAGEAPRRYLWTDAFAVCNFLGLYRQMGDETYRDLALLLVDQVHDTLGRHREDDPREGWISGLGEQEGRAHPTKGGLRIGKKMKERGRGEPFDETLEWERDGQYYHYLTRWMHALNRVTRVTGDRVFNRWAMELAKTAHARFSYVPFPGGQKHMYWKMSIDLSYPLVPSMGHHDPLDGLITYSQLQAAADKDPQDSTGLDLREEIADMAKICRGKSWATDDPLGIGGLLCDAYRVAQLMVNADFWEPDLLGDLLVSSLPGLESSMRMHYVDLPADYRLAFRELGLTIGLRAVGRLKELIEEKSDLLNEKRQLLTQLEDLIRYTSLIEVIENFWLENANREAASWREHLDINMVMLATSLAPDGYLTL